MEEQPAGGSTETSGKTRTHQAQIGKRETAT